jgi:polysaccharide biosynthesis transport protein
MIPSHSAEQHPGVLEPTLPAVASATALQVYAPLQPFSTAPNMLGLLWALRRRWMVALSLALCGASIAAGAVWFSQKTLFTARTLLHVSSSQPHILFNVGGQGDFGSYQRNQVALIRSRLVLKRALDNPKVKDLELVKAQEDPVAWLERAIQVDFGTAPEILRIGLTGENKEELIPIVDAVRDAYVKDIVNKEYNQRSSRLGKLKALYDEQTDRLKKKRIVYDQMSESIGTKNEKTQEWLYTLGVTTISSLQSDILRIETEKIKAKAELSMEQKKEAIVAGGAPVPDDMLDQYVQADPTVAILQREKAKLEKDIMLIEENVRDPENEPVLKKNKKRLEQNKKELESFRVKLRPQMEAKLKDQLKFELRMHLAGFQQRVEMLEQLDELLKKELNDRTDSLKNFKKDMSIAESLKEEMAITDGVLKTITGQTTALAIELDHAPERVTALEEALAVQDTDGRVKKSSMAGAGTFALILFGVAFLEFRKHKVNSVDDIVRNLAMRIMGTVPEIPERARRNMGSGTKIPRDAYWQSVLTESVDAARTVLLHMAHEQSKKIVMVTSAVGGEGKTLLSCHLAVSLARAGFRTLLIDGDLRRPAVHRVFNFPLDVGFSDLLRDQLDTSIVVQPSPMDGLWILPAGHSDTAAFQGLARHKCRDIFKLLRDQYDFILVDSAPVLPVADSLLIGQCVDGVIFSVLRDVSRLPTVYAAYERLSSLHVNILGAVVNGAQADYYRNRYYYNKATPETPANAAVEDAVVEE